VSLLALRATIFLTLPNVPATGAFTAVFLLDFTMVFVLRLLERMNFSSSLLLCHGAEISLLAATS